MALPRDLSQMRDLSFSDSLTLYERLRQHSGMLVIDAGGHENAEFLGQLARACTDVWLVTDQSVSALVALDGLLSELESRSGGAPQSRPGRQPLRRALRHGRGADRPALRDAAGGHAARSHAGADGLP